MMVFPATMRPQALMNNEGSPYRFTCDLCGENGEGRFVRPGGTREEWAVLPEEWAEVEDRRPEVKKQFMVVCDNEDCQHVARERANFGM